MIKVHLARMMGERKLNITDVARATNLNRNTVTLLYRETARRVDFETLEVLCKLFECEVGDLIEYIEE
ncbi:helix-turn-helix domain-containing protein [Pseudidiomarina donghaiensis]|uniref:XRE family transcriptional regulator n=2 Tax=Pseudidiomarina donghaiensis TaxID=519452 RepID=A0A432XJT2_9GAMM|nr:helix-turn-helix transcriptional regulator [Pseudidiomarina donghaiensis]RUO48971.1 XRE family transcriptional regulator [Pseudidiomarina donghaiensis]SFV20344.1 putative transcriptional regulator [Pseudidiomarina donghaiensis]